VSATARAGDARRRTRREPGVLRLTTTGRRTGLPREVALRFTRRAGRCYLVSEAGERAQWVRNLRTDPRVRWRIRARTYRGRSRVLDGAHGADLAAAVKVGFEAKYGWGDGLVVELRPEGPRRARG
jgi:deazaflavin-dependent oxidoreductase (nitroreductase family)